MYRLLALPGGAALARAYVLCAGCWHCPAALRLHGPTGYVPAAGIARRRCACAGLRVMCRLLALPGGAALARAYG